MTDLDDTTLGGYQRVHERPPAFGGSDGHSYSVAVYVADEQDARGLYGAALLFVRWSEAGDRPVGHVETDYLAHGSTKKDAMAPVLTLTLHEVKAHLEQALQGRRA